MRRAALRLARSLNESFWFRPALLSLFAAGLALVLLEADRRSFLPFREGRGVDLLTAIGSTAIAVAGTVFSITIAAMTLASAQMGPRLLRNFVRDAGTQSALGVFIGTFVYCLVVSRASAQPEYDPGLATSVGVALGFLCVGTLIYYIHHVATAINVQSVIARISPELRASLLEATVPSPPDTFAAATPEDGARIVIRRSGYVTEVEEDVIAAVASRNDACVHLTHRPGDYLLAGTTVAIVAPATAGDRLARSVVRGVRLGPRRTVYQDPEYAVRQLVEIGVRALSPAINDPFTAISVLEHLGDGLMRVAGRHLFDGVTRGAEGVPLVVRPATDYEGLVDAMFAMLREYGASSPGVTIRLVEVLTDTLEAERDPDRRAILARHADLAIESGELHPYASSDRDDLRARHRRFREILSRDG